MQRESCVSYLWAMQKKSMQKLLQSKYQGDPKGIQNTKMPILLNIDSLWLVYELLPHIEISKNIQKNNFWNRNAKSKAKILFKDWMSIGDSPVYCWSIWGEIKVTMYELLSEILPQMLQSWAYRHQM